MFDEADVERGPGKKGRENECNEGDEHLRISSGSFMGGATMPYAPLQYRSG
jgi:hypothetical protein